MNTDTTYAGLSLRDTARLIGSSGAPAAGREQATGNEDAFSMEQDTYTATIGCAAAAGGLVGGIWQYNEAMGQVRQQPLNTVHQEWNEPVMRDRVIGKMPENYYEPRSVFGFSHHVTYKNVVEPAPVLGADGKPQMQFREQTWSDHGTPVVTRNTYAIKDPFLRGVNEFRMEDTSSYERVVPGQFTRSEDGQFVRDAYGDRVPVKETVSEIRGWNHSFSADIGQKDTGYTYEMPTVRFETGVNVAGRTILGVLCGAFVGGASAALVMAGIQRAQQNAA